MKTDFSTFDLIKALKIPRERLRDWMNRDYVRPSKRARGQGDKASFTREDVHMVGLFRSLIDSGFSREVAGGFVAVFAKASKQEKEETDFLLFRIVGKRILVLALNGRDEPRIDLVTGSPLDENGLRVMTDQDWRGSYDQIHLVNYGKIEKQVDEALSILE